MDKNRGPGRPKGKLGKHPPSVFPEGLSSVRIPAGGNAIIEAAAAAAEGVSVSEFVRVAIGNHVGVTLALAEDRSWFYAIGDIEDQLVVVANQANIKAVGEADKGARL